MHPELLNNPLFLRYYRQWQQNPNSVVFASIAEFFLHYHLIDEAHKVCREGLLHSPSCVSGHLAMAKIHLARSNWDEAELALNAVLMLHSMHPRALQLRERIRVHRAEEELARQSLLPESSAALSPEDVERAEEITHPLHDEGIPGAGPLLPENWQTMTMARIFQEQGHDEQARKIFLTILEREPNNEAAKAGLVSLGASAEMEHRDHPQ